MVALVRPARSVAQADRHSGVESEMPELPEVEIMAQNLDRWLRGRCIRGVELQDPKFEGLGLGESAGSTVVRAWRRAKYAVVDLDCGRSFLIHYRMTGKTVLDEDRSRRARLWIEVDTGESIAFVDPRRFGEFMLVPTASLTGIFEAKSLGPEPWPHRRDGLWWAKALNGLRGPIKTAMMRQDRVVGIGNILASESLFLARLHPCRASNRLDSSEWQRLADAVHQVIERTLAAESGDEIAYVNMGGQGSFLVYGHGGEPCPRCSQPIVRIVQSSRSTFYCSACVDDDK